MGGKPVFDIIKCAVLNLSRKKSRTALTALSIAVGVASVILISTVSLIGTQTINNELNSLGIGAIMVSGSVQSGVGLGENHLAVLQSQKEIKEAVPILTEKSKIKSRNLTFDAMVWGIDSGAKQIFNLETLFGSLFKKEDLITKKQVCLVDETMAHLLYSRSNIVGKNIDVLLNGSYYSFEVIGVVASGGNIAQSVIGDIVPSFVYIPYSSMQNLLGKRKFDQIALQLDETMDVDDYAKTVISLLEQEEGKGGVFSAQNVARQKDRLNNILAIVAQVLSIIAGISMVVAGLGIMIVMLASVSERTREIGIKKSIGASQAMIIKEFLFEAVALSAIGCVFGICAGLALAWGGCKIIHIDFTADYSAVLKTAAFALVNGLVFGVYPSIIAARLKPVDALRQE